MRPQAAEQIKQNHSLDTGTIDITSQRDDCINGNLRKRKPIAKGRATLINTLGSIYASIAS